ncbi:hypothetical protein GQ54DRAFT_299088 [Martensiomyces pterosporus]|nr:hypothetical protein GQ54DRAFT_299088 [Martensiomyces pterosporus]
MHSLKKLFSFSAHARSPSTGSSSSGRQALQQPSANFLDLDFEDNVTHHPHCFPTCRSADSAATAASAGGAAAAAAAALGQRPVSQSSTGGISWEDVEARAAMDDSDAADRCGEDRCRHCNISISPASSRAWHERMCVLGHNSASSYPDHCEMCQKKFRSPQHAKNHYFYGCAASA